ncbi:PREDICTED: transcription factor WER-like [Nicotiana attenuata]|uniref:Myb-related protein myb4 n=1 Tax=Nicotiana attenuata TaxID=49451 RepID=A0A1J6KQ22_NICAT|nr:PREDICTED: transcription factor WER-like [Nicotiana attenuata]OIT26936.1 myb-related protein myb4 [Nicotiana attenuata]
MSSVPQQQQKSTNMEEIKKGAWSWEEDQKLKDYIMRYGIWNWSNMPRFAGLSRTGKSCRIRWMNYLHPEVKKGPFSIEERETVIKMYQQLGTRWSAIAAKLPGRTDKDVKNFFYTHLKKHLGMKNDALLKFKARRKRVEKTKKSEKKINPEFEKAQERPILLLAINNLTIGTSSNNSLISPDVSSSNSSIITFEENQKMNNVDDQPIIDMENTVILESNPETHLSDHSLSIESMDQFDTSSFWFHLLNDAHRLIL